MRGQLPQRQHPHRGTTAGDSSVQRSQAETADLRHRRDVPNWGASSFHRGEELQEANALPFTAKMPRQWEPRRLCPWPWERALAHISWSAVATDGHAGLRIRLR